MCICIILLPLFVHVQHQCYQLIQAADRNYYPFVLFYTGFCFSVASDAWRAGSADLAFGLLPVLNSQFLSQQLPGPLKWSKLQHNYLFMFFVISELVASDTWEVWHSSLRFITAADPFLSSSTFF